MIRTHLLVNTLSVFLLLVAIFIGSYASAQDQISLYATPGITQQYTDNTNASGLYEARFATCFGALYRHEIVVERLWLQAGVEWVDSGSQLDVDKLTFSDQIDSRRGFVFHTGEGNLKNIKFRQQQVSIPLLAYCRLTQSERWRFVAAMGGSVDYLLTNHTVFVWEESRDRSTQDLDYYKRLTFSARMDFLLSRKLSELFSIEAGPSIRLGLSDMRKEGYSSMSTSNYGFRVGLVRKI